MGKDSNCICNYCGKTLSSKDRFVALSKKNIKYQRIFARFPQLSGVDLNDLLIHRDCVSNGAFAAANNYRRTLFVFNTSSSINNLIFLLSFSLGMMYIFVWLITPGLDDSSAIIWYQFSVIGVILLAYFVLLSIKMYKIVRFFRMGLIDSRKSFPYCHRFIWLSVVLLFVLPGLMDISVWVKFGMETTAALMLFYLIIDIIVREKDQFKKDILMYGERLLQNSKR